MQRLQSMGKARPQQRMQHRSARHVQPTSGMRSRFVHKFTILHFLDRCTRWEAGVIIPDKTAPSLMKGIDTAWISIHGPPKELICDGESGIVGTEAGVPEYLHRKGVKLHPRAKDQHAIYAERGGALLRDAIHRIEGQLKEEGITGLPFECILSEAMFCGNALLTVGGSTPYNALYGRVPRVLPRFDQRYTLGMTVQTAQVL